MGSKFGTATCQICGKTFEKKALTAKYCSDECRKIMRQQIDRMRWEKAKEEKKEEPTVASTCPKDCKYRGLMSGTPCCDYILIKKEPRGCDITECDKYEKGKKKKGWGPMPLPGMKR
jgi:hypothetical protein